MVVDMEGSLSRGSEVGDLGEEVRGERLSIVGGEEVRRSGVRILGCSEGLKGAETGSW